MKSTSLLKCVAGLFGSSAVCATSVEPAARTAPQRPNILFIIADDASLHLGQSYGCGWVKTPNIDRLAAAGLVFDQAYTPCSKCAPARAAILTGRNPWQLGPAANHMCVFPPELKVFSEVMIEKGIAVDGEGKNWAPGLALTASNQPRSFGFSFLSDGTLVSHFGDFLRSRPERTPFFYWFGSRYPHRPYRVDDGIRAGKRPNQIDRVPAFWPDNEIVRRDMLDYAVQLELFDLQIGELMRLLELSGELNHTLVVITSDNGMPFPHIKGQNYELSVRIPLIIHWPDGIVSPGRRVREPVSLIDLAPTFFELIGLDAAECGMPPFTGRSLCDVLFNRPGPVRDFVLTGRERNGTGLRAGDGMDPGYPVRAIHSDGLIYIRNFEPERSPAGDAALGFKEIDAGPTKELIVKSGDDRFLRRITAPRNGEELFDTVADPECMNDLSANPEYRERLDHLRDKLFRELAAQRDPRVLGQGSLFDQYPSSKPLPGMSQVEFVAKMKELGLIKKDEESVEIYSNWYKERMGEDAKKK